MTWNESENGMVWLLADDEGHTIGRVDVVAPEINADLDQVLRINNIDPGRFTGALGILQGGRESWSGAVYSQRAVNPTVGRYQSREEAMTAVEDWWKYWLANE